MPDARKRAVLALAQQHDIVILKMMCTESWLQNIHVRAQSILGQRRSGATVQLIYQIRGAGIARRLGYSRSLSR